MLHHQCLQQLDLHSRLLKAVVMLHHPEHCLALQLVLGWGPDSQRAWGLWEACRHCQHQLLEKQLPELLSLPASWSSLAAAEVPAQASQLLLLPCHPG